MHAPDAIAAQPGRQPDARRVSDTGTSALSSTSRIDPAISNEIPPTPSDSHSACPPPWLAR